MSNIVLKGSTSGDVTITVPAEAGTNTLTLPAGTGNIITSTTAGTTIQTVNVQTGALATGTTRMPLDDTIPQKTEGDEYMTLAITPTNASNKLKIEVVFIGTDTAVQTFVAAIFQDSTAGALAVGACVNSNQHGIECLNVNHYMTAGTTSATTFKVRAGGNNSGTTTFNGQQGARRYGGSFASSITITEIAV